MRRYLAHVADSRRWEALPLRSDDIVICSPSKCGTTWTQMVVALLVLDQVPLPAPLSELSPWVDMRTQRAEVLRARLEAQTHRRFLKTHVPLDGLPRREGVTYVVVGRDPRDAWVSMEHQASNLDVARAMALRDDDAGSPEPAPELPDAPDARFRAQLELPVGSNHTDAHLAQIVHLLHGAWKAQGDGSVVMLHYADLADDLAGTMHRLAGRLGLPRTAARCAELAQAATFASMRAGAERLAPNATDGVWHEPARFFRSGRGGEWVPWFTPEVAARYAERLDALTEGDAAFIAWLHRGAAPVPPGEPAVPSPPPPGT